MIHAGREAVDTAAIAELHGLPPSKARRVRPWAEHDHPARITTGTPGRGQPDLWDREQAEAYARGVRGDDLPTLPEAPGPSNPGNPDDLLDRNECAALLDVEPKTWTDYKVPGGVSVCGREHWKRRTVEAFKRERDERAEQPRGGRPRGSTEAKPRADVAREIRELVESGETNVAKISRRVGVAYSTAHQHVSEILSAQK